MKYMSKENDGEGGHIIQLSSIAGINTVPLVPIYCSAKHAVIAFTKCFGVSFSYLYFKIFNL